MDHGCARLDVLRFFFSSIHPIGKGEWGIGKAHPEGFVGPPRSWGESRGQSGKDVCQCWARFRNPAETLGRAKLGKRDQRPPQHPVLLISILPPQRGRSCTFMQDQIFLPWWLSFSSSNSLWALFFYPPPFEGLSTNKPTTTVHHSTFNDKLNLGIGMGLFTWGGY